MSVVTVTTRTCPRSNCDCSRASDGISSLHGPHQVAQKLSTTTLPAKCCELKVAPSSALRSNATVGPPAADIGVTPSAPKGSMAAEGAPYSGAPETDSPTYAATITAQAMRRSLLRSIGSDLHFCDRNSWQLHRLNHKTMHRHRVFLPPHHDRSLLIDPNRGCLTVLLIQFSRLAKGFSTIQ